MTQKESKPPAPWMTPEARLGQRKRALQREVDRQGPEIVLQRNPARRRAAAYHEAGHAVMARVVGGRLIQVRSGFELLDVPEPRYIDRRRFALPRVRWALSGGPDNETVPKRVRFKYAGFVAETRACGTSASIASRRDFSDATQLLSLLHPNPNDLEAAEHAAKDEVAELMAKPAIWEAVESVSALLEKSGSIDPAVVTELIDQHIGDAKPDNGASRCS